MHGERERAAQYSKPSKYLALINQQTLQYCQAKMKGCKRVRGLIDIAVPLGNSCHVPPFHTTNQVVRLLPAVGAHQYKFYTSKGCLLQIGVVINDAVGSSPCLMSLYSCSGRDSICTLDILACPRPGVVARATGLPPRSVEVDFEQFCHVYYRTIENFLLCFEILYGNLAVLIADDCRYLFREYLSRVLLSNGLDSQGEILCHTLFVDVLTHPGHVEIMWTCEVRSVTA